MMATELPPTGIAVDALAAYANRYRDLFSRADQLSRLTAYLRGLLDDDGAKNVEAIARRVSSADGFAQALQHFVSSSPWDADRLAARYRSLLPLKSISATWVVLDAVFPKKGRRSVGVHRQFARSLGRKINCQVAVAVALIDGDAVHPLALRLYLPTAWLRDNAAVAERTIPAAYREPRTKAVLARELVSGLAEELGPPAAVVAEEGYADELAAAGVAVTSDEAALIDAREKLARVGARLGLNAFEGRTWTGYTHHLALVLAAHGFTVAGELVS